MVTLRMLEIARQEARHHNLTRNFAQRDMHNIPWRSTCDAAYWVWESFGLLDDAGNQDFVQAVRETLKPGGKFLIENHTIATLPSHFWDKGWRQADLLERRQLDHVTNRLESSWLFVRFPNGAVETQHMSMRLYTYRELCELLSMTGFSGFEGFDTKSGKPFAFGAERLSLLTNRTGKAALFCHRDHGFGVDVGTGVGRPKFCSTISGDTSRGSGSVGMACRQLSLSLTT